MLASGTVVRAALVTSVCLGVVLATRTAFAIPYETFIDIENQADLDDLLASGDIAQETYDELLELLASGVDLATADRAELYALPNLTYDDVDRIIAFREQQKGVLPDPGALVDAGVLTEDKLLGIAAFLILKAPGDKLGLRGFVRASTRASLNDDRLPPLALHGRFTLLKDVRAGFAGTFTRFDIGAPVYDPNRDALVADGTGYRVALPKFFVKKENDKISVIAGTFRAGFAQRLTFDNSRHYTPNGLYHDDDLTYSAELVRSCRESAGELPVSPCAGAKGDEYVTPDWSWRNGLLGAGVGYKRLEIGTGWLQAYIWGSIAKQSIYQYELADRSDGKCEDPHDDDDATCAAPTVYVTPDGSNPLAPAARHSFQTLPNVFEERLIGANVTYFADRRNGVGLTAYGAQEKSLVEGLTLDTQEWSRIPTGGRFGAAGANFAFGRNAIDIFGEIAHSFDQMPANDDGRYGPQRGGGGPAAVVRVTASRKKEELEGVLRYYGVDFANPYGRPIAQSDEFDGQRARDEVGARLRYIKSDKLYTVRTGVDLWAPVTSLRNDSPLGRVQPKFETYARADVRTSHELWLGMWLRYQDKDLQAGGHDQCFSYSTEFDENGEPRPCGGRQLTTIVRAKYVPNKKVSYTAMFEHQLLDDPGLSMTKFRQDMAGWLIALWRPEKTVRVRGRLRYLDEDISNPSFLFGGDDTYLERSLSAVIDGGFVVRGRDTVRVRLDGKVWLDDRDSTKDRDPNPELQLWLSYEARL